MVIMSMLMAVTNEMPVELQNTEGAQVHVLEVRDVYPNPEQPREYFDDEEMQQLARSISAIGQRTPIDVQPIDNGKWVIVEGQRRWYAIGTLLDRQYINALVLPAMSDDAMFLSSVVANFCRQGHTPLETAKAMYRLRSMGMSIELVAYTLGKSESWVYKYLRLLELPPEVQELMSPERPDNKRLKLSIAVTLCEAKADPEFQIRMARKACVDGTTVQQAQHTIRALAVDKGVSLKRLESTPNKDFRVLAGFVKRLGKESSMYIDMPGRTLTSLLETRPPGEIEELVVSLQKAHGDLGALLEELQRIQGAKE
jgi:ParB/RepB/Spo0J family partition protein